MSAYRLVTHITLSLSSALTHVRLVNDPVKRTGVFPLNPLNSSGLADVMKNQNTVISTFLFKANNRLPKTMVFAELVNVHTQYKYT